MSEGEYLEKKGSSKSRCPFFKSLTQLDDLIDQSLPLCQTAQGDFESGFGEG
jgi:hypothetical protein